MQYFHFFRHMKLKTSYQPYRLNFTFLAKTSRGSMQHKPTYFVKMEDRETGKVGLGECSTIAGLSIDPPESYEQQLVNCLQAVAHSPDPLQELYQLTDLKEFPSILFGLEMALADLEKGGDRQLFHNAFSRGQAPIPINGLVWMGESQQMSKQMLEKAQQGFSCIKLKIGGIDFEEECELLALLRKQFPKITIRLDANGAFTPSEALSKLEKLSQYHIHSIEQPIMPKQWAKMAGLCRNSPIPIALDEELIGVMEKEEKVGLLEEIQPPYIILKPALLGGFKHAAEWIAFAEARKIGWWNTSALESNIGLNAIAQFTANYPVTLPQGLGTGMLYHNNIGSPLTITQGYLKYDSAKSWNLSALDHNWVSA